MFCFRTGSRGSFTSTATTPYAFAPFCKDRPEAEECRLWNDGCWRNMLIGKRYHISALFVVELEQLKR
jgi:UDP-glucose:glycoprotein glucosyltransferase